MKFFVTLLFVLSICGIANAQITITSAEYLAALIAPTKPSVSYSSYDTTGMNALIAQSGAAQTWDFSHFTFTKDQNSGGSQIVNVVPFSTNGGPLANDPLFTTATHIVEFEQTSTTSTDTVRFYEYVKITASEVAVCGIVITDSLGKGSILFAYGPPKVQYKFPLTYQSSWTSSSYEYGLYTDTTNGATHYSIEEVTVDGYGTLVTPTSAHSKGGVPLVSTETLRLKTKVTSIFGIPGALDTSSYYNFGWSTKSGHSASIFTNPAMNAISASYLSNATNGVDDIKNGEALELHLSSNPASQLPTILTYIVPEAGATQVVLMDALGRESRMLSKGYANAGANSVLIDPMTLSNGTYFIQVVSGNFKATQKLVVSK